ncbi:MAG: ABC transporter ATP-binding protein [Acidobacteria bacterium]|nr:ABC transporter ATP-binding protein [Acidobacteriota bacterium]
MKGITTSTKQILSGFWAHTGEDRPRYYLSFVLMGLTLLFDLGRPFILKNALDHAGSGLLDRLKVDALIFLGLVLLEYLARSGFNYLLSIAFLKTITRIRQAVFDHVIYLRQAFFEREPVGKLLTRTVNDAESLGETLRSGIATIFVDILTILGLLIIMFQLELRLAPVVILTIPLVLITVRWSGVKLKAKYLEIRILLAKANGFMAEGLNGVEILQLFQHEQESNRAFRKINRDYNMTTITSNIYDASLYAIVDGIAILTTAAVIYWCYASVLGPIEISSLIVFINLIDRIYVPIRDLSGKFTIIQQAIAALDRIFELFQTPHVTASGAHQIQEDQVHIAFRDVQFQYQASGRPVVQNIFFEIHPGQVVALVGQTGSGKSTLTKLLTKTYDGYQGEILINGHELKDLNTFSLRQKLAVVHQDFHLFPGSLRENIRLFNTEISDSDLLETIHLIHAGPLLEQLEGGLDFELREDGANLSTGQRQLIVFARALVHQAPVLIMDEATSSVDSKTEAWIQDALHEIYANRTVLVIAHRLSTIQEADLILVLQDGQIIERGTHSELLERSGIYAELARSVAHEGDPAGQLS